MKKLFEYGDEYAQESTWRDFALLKFCLAALGTAMGLCAPKKWKTPALIASIAVFVGTLIPLMVKFVRIILRGRNFED